MVEETKQSNFIFLTASEEGSSWEVGGVIMGLSYDSKNPLGKGAMGKVYFGECVYKKDGSKEQVAVKKLKKEIYE